MIPVFTRALAATAFLTAATSSQARADLKLCNATASRIGVSIGYQDPTGWATEGWWNITSQTCETLLKGAVPSRFVYVYAVDYDRGGEWAGTNFMCTADKSFAIRGFRTARNADISARVFLKSIPERHKSGRCASPIQTIKGLNKNEAQAAGSRSLLRVDPHHHRQRCSSASSWRAWTCSAST